MVRSSDRRSAIQRPLAIQFNSGIPPAAGQTLRQIPLSCGSQPDKRFSFFLARSGRYKCCRLSSLNQPMPYSAVRGRGLLTKSSPFRPGGPRHDRWAARRVWVGSMEASAQPGDRCGHLALEERAGAPFPPLFRGWLMYKCLLMTDFGFDLFRLPKRRRTIPCVISEGTSASWTHNRTSGPDGSCRLPRTATTLGLCASISIVRWLTAIIR